MQHDLVYPGGTVTVLRFSDDDQYLVAGSGNTVYLWEMATGTLVDTFIGHTEAIEAVDISADNSQLASASLDNMALIFNIANGSIDARFSIRRCPCWLL